MAKTKSYWFPHDTTAFSDMKIESMLSVYGAEGYGLYWIIVETLSMEEGYKLIMSKKSVWGVLAKRSGVDIDKVKEFVDDCISDFGLFKSRGEYFWSESLTKRLEKRDKASKAARDNAAKRWGGKEKEKPIPKPKAPVKKESDLEGFNEFWSLYDKKVGKDKSLSLWNKLSKKDKESCMEYIPDYIKHRPDKQYRKNPETFLRNKSWNDEIVKKAGSSEPSFDNMTKDEFKQAFE